MRTIALGPIVLCCAAFGTCQPLNTVATYLTPKANATLSPRFDPARFARVAVIVTDNTNRVGDGYRHQVEDAFMRAIMAKGYILAARSDVDEVVRELRFQARGYTAQDVMRIGNMLNVTGLVIASIDNTSMRSESYQRKDGSRNTVYYSDATVSARLVSVQQAEVLWIASYTGSRYIGEGSRDQYAGIPSAANVVANSFPSAIASVSGGSGR